MKTSRRPAATELPRLGDDFAPPFVTAQLAAFFGVDMVTFVEYAGGDWRPVDGERLRGVKHKPVRWFGCGNPLVALMGIADHYVTVAVPHYFPGGLSGPPTLEGRRAVDVSLRSKDALSRLEAKLADARDASRRDWNFCIGCHDFGPFGLLGELQLPYCRSCLITYLGVILD